MSARRWIGIAASLVLLGAPVAVAQGPDSVETAHRQHEADLMRQAREKRAQAQKLKGQENKALTQLKRTQRDIGVTKRRLQNLQRRQRQLDDQLGVTRAIYERSVQSLEQQKQRLARRLRNVYKTGANRDMEFMLSAQSFGQLLARWDYLVMVAEQDRLIMEDIRGRKEQVEADQQRLEVNLSAAEIAAKRTTSESRRLNRLEEERRSNVRTIQSQRQAFEAAAEELEKTARQIRGLLAQL